jgi:hypothetical protein
MKLHPSHAAAAVTVVFLAAVAQHFVFADAASPGAGSDPSVPPASEALAKGSPGEGNVQDLTY